MLHSPAVHPHRHAARVCLHPSDNHAILANVFFPCSSPLSQPHKHPGFEPILQVEFKIRKLDRNRLCLGLRLPVSFQDLAVRLQPDHNTIPATWSHIEQAGSASVQLCFPSQAPDHNLSTLLNPFRQNPLDPCLQFRTSHKLHCPAVETHQNITLSALPLARRFPSHRIPDFIHTSNGPLLLSFVSCQLPRHHSLGHLWLENNSARAVQGLLTHSNRHAIRLSPRPVLSHLAF
mmetsp:Transcript_14977/g.35302  ORF Transcript_14977/g.35302 Transcript_14977/m.35302 type:complete len:233 (+) Transcript_14977:595-1293(+)